MANQKPAHEVRMGKIKAAIWTNESDSGMRCNVVVSRLYKDGERWRSADTFGRDDLPLLIKVLDRAHDYLFDAARTDA